MCAIEDLDTIKKKADEIAPKIATEYVKGKIPLFVIGAGTSRELTIPNSLKEQVTKMSIPTMDEVLSKLYTLFEDFEKTPKGKERNVDLLEVKKHFGLWKDRQKEDRKIDRATVGGIFGHFQDKEYLKEVWIDFNNWLLKQCVSEKHEIGIITARPSEAHYRIAELYEKVGALCLTTNFDGLLLKSLMEKYTRDHVFSYYTAKQIKQFFQAEPVLGTVPHSDYVEIQIRGDIFFAKCDEKWCDIFDRCEFPKETHTFGYYAIGLGKESETDPLKCPKGRIRKPFVSFPGSLEKDREIRGIVEVLWQYLAYKVSCIITVGIGGWWDPILLAFLSDLARERGVPFIDANLSPEDSYISKEIVEPNNSLKIDANRFMSILSNAIDKSMLNVHTDSTTIISYSRETEGEDKFWDEFLGFEISDFEKNLMRHPLVDITQKFAQLGLKSRWWGVGDLGRWHHTRLNHAKGVMKVSAFLYDRACENSNRETKQEERQFLRIGALLHDIGHLPFSHLMEEVFQELNWRPSGYTESFSHDYSTSEKVKTIFENQDLRRELSRLGYDVNDLINLMNGNFGIGFLDAIINGPIDADKIDYVFRDAASTEVFPHTIEPSKFLSNIGKEISISHTGMLVLKGISVEAALEVLRQRSRLYKEFYLHPATRLLEKALKFILTTYFVHTYNTLDIPHDTRRKYLNGEVQLSDMGAIRISMATQELETLVNKFKASQDIEMSIIQDIEKYLKTRPLSNMTTKSLDKCFDLVKSINGEMECKDVSSRLKYDWKISGFTRENVDKMRYDAKTVMLRFPGTIMIDVLSPFEFWKAPTTRRARARSDGTNVGSESLLSPTLVTKVSEHMRANREEATINIYRIGEESDFERALSLFEELIGRERGPEEVE